MTIRSPAARSDEQRAHRGDAIGVEAAPHEPRVDLVRVLEPALREVVDPRQQRRDRAHHLRPQRLLREVVEEGLLELLLELPAHVAVDDRADAREPEVLELVELLVDARGRRRVSRAGRTAPACAPTPAPTCRRSTLPARTPRRTASPPPVDATTSDTLSDVVATDAPPEDTGATADVLADAGSATDTGVDASDGAACPADRTRCSAVCVDLARDVANCGACGVACPAGVACVASACTGLRLTRYIRVMAPPEVRFIDACAVPGHTEHLPATYTGSVRVPIPFAFR